MASTINGTSTGSGGLISTGDDSGILNIQTNETTAITVDANQMVGIGTTTPKVRLAGKVLSINGTDSGANYQASIELLVNGGSAGELWANSNDFVIGSYSTQPMIFRTQNTERMRIDSSGSVLIGTTSTSAQGKKLYVTDSQSGTNDSVIKFENSASSAGGRVITCNANYAGTVIAFDKSNTGVGTISVTASNTAYNTSSDYRLKDNVQPMSGALAKVALLKPVTFKWKIDGSDSEGFIAHELQAIKPDCVSGDKDAVDADGNPQYQGIDTSFLVATLTAALQETKALIDTQAETINALTARVVALETA